MADSKPKKVADAKDRNTVKSADGVNRIIPQGPFDQGETEQVGGTVVNRPKNKGENDVEHHPDAKKKDAGDPEDHAINEEAEHVDEENKKLVKEHEKDNKDK